MVFENRMFNYEELVKQTLLYESRIKGKIPCGCVVGALVDYSFSCVALFLALALNRNIIIPLSKDAIQKHKDYIDIGKARYLISIDGEGKLDWSEVSALPNDNELYRELLSKNHAGLVLFSSGSSGPPKGIVHDLETLSSAYKISGKAYRTLIFLQMDHIGGVNTLLYNLRNQGVIIIPNSRMPEDVCKCIEKNRVELLPTSPTFLNLMILSEMTSRYDLSSLKLITYGTEPMPEGTLKRIREILPDVRFKQTYGLSETGILNTKSREDGSLWVKVGGDGFDIKIRDNKLWIKSKYSMIGYLNADSPFEADGYINTGDVVEIDGDWVKILGRESELINVGGNKVFPAEVESVLQKMPEIEDVVVYGLPNPLTGQMVATIVKTKAETELSDFKVRMRAFCKTRLEPYKIPVKVAMSDENLYSERFKKKRNIKSEKFS